MRKNEDSEMTPHRLQIVQIRDVAYFVDVRLREIREVARPWVSISFDSDMAEELLWSEFFLFDCPSCFKPTILSVRGDPVICSCCGQDVREALRSVGKRLGA